MAGAMRRRVARYWAVLRRPSTHYSLGFLTVVSFLMGIIFWGGFNTAMEFTNTEEFCTGCHAMRDNVFAELKGTKCYRCKSTMCIRGCSYARTNVKCVIACLCTGDPNKCLRINGIMRIRTIGVFYCICIFISIIIL